MLSQQTITTVKATVPALLDHGETLTQHFYKRMFEKNPEVAPFFNHANQTAGKQQRALAGAIVAYAQNIENLDVLQQAVELIAQKHASLQIKPEHYPIVGANLLESIKEVMGEAATEEVVSAWGEAYGFLADILMGREAEIYTNLEKKAGGWESFKPFKIVRKQVESSVITSFYLAPADEAPLPVFEPGQYLSVRVKTPDGSTTMRNYSLSDEPGQPYFRISVKQERGRAPQTPDGYVSSYLHETLNTGDTIDVAAPFGEFTLDLTSKRPVVFLAGGIGITPLMSMLTTLLKQDPDRDVLFVHASLNAQVQAFREKLDGFAAEHEALRVHHRYSETIKDQSAQNPQTSSGFVDADYLDSLIPDRNADYYFCGPEGFMRSVEATLLQWNVPAQQVNYEFFGPKTA